MTDLLAHRGPDDAGFWSASAVAFGHRRLSIIDLSPDGHQPMHLDDRYTIVFNGEIYNYRELRERLRGDGASFATASDTEVILRAYARWGHDCPRYLNGIFAFAIWDARDRTLFCARDRVGVKPFYYRFVGDAFAFASEAKSLIVAALGGSPAIDRRGLSNYLAFGHAVGEQTIWHGIRKLAPGHTLTIGSSGFRSERYWDVTFAPDERMSLGDAAARMRQGLETAVRRQMVADVPVGAFLSGGVDSSAVVALMARESRAARVSTYSLGFVDGGIYNELDAAATVARHIGTDHHAVELRVGELPDLLDTLVWHYDEPFADAAAFPLFIIARAASADLKVVLTGEGGDELFAGYRRFALERFAPYYQRVPAFARGLIGAASRALPRARRAKQALRSMDVSDPAERAGAWQTVFDAVGRKRLLRSAASDALSDLDVYEPYRRCHDPERGAIDNLLYTDFKTWLPDAYLEKVDKATMASGLEARVPILDHELVELAATIPARHKIRGRHMKIVLKKAVEDLLPRKILQRPKRGFAVPTDPWFRGAMYGLTRDTLLGPSALSTELFERTEIDRLLREHRSGRDVHDTRLWTILNFELWLRRFGITPTLASA